MNEDSFESDWCDFHNGHNQSEDDVNHDQVLHFMREIEPQKDNESTKTTTTKNGMKQVITRTLRLHLMGQVT